MRSTSIIYLIALPATFANLLGVDIVGPTSYHGLRVEVKINSADQLRTMLPADYKSGPNEIPKESCLESDQWSDNCDGVNVVQVLGHIEFTEPTKEPRLIKMYAPDHDTFTTWTTSVSYSSSSAISRVN
jgi:hypothetical protein